MRQKIIVASTIVLAGAVVGGNRASACSTTDPDTDTADLNMFLCQGGPNPLPVNGVMDPRSSIYFARYGRPSVTHPQGCESSLVFLPAVPAPSCQTVPCPDPGFMDGTGDSQWSFFIQDFDRWHLDSNEWSANGKSDTAFYDANQPYSKILNSAYLIWFGIKDNADIVFHGTQDYVGLSRANDSAYHDSFFRSVTGASDIDGLYNEHLFGDDEIETSCNVYSGPGGGTNNVVYRTGVLLHEAWHGWENLYMNRGGTFHQPGPQGNCTLSGPDSCDRFFSHTLAAFRPFGTLHEGVTPAPDCPLAPRDCARDVDPKKFHSPNQIAFEFGCDLIVSPADWVTTEILMDAQVSQANFNSRFINAPPMQCGSNSPMMN